MKASQGQVEKALDKPSVEHRLILLYGPDESGSRTLAARIERAMGPDAERIDLDSATLKADPARLADEAASISLFGGARHIRLTLSSPEDAFAAVQALVEAPMAGNPVVAIAGTLRATSALLKFALAHPAVLAFASYAPEGQQADRIAISMAQAAGLRIGNPDVARRLAGAAAGDRAVLKQEIDKFALYLDASPEQPADLDHATLDLLGADADEGDLSRLVDAVLSGNPAALGGELARLRSVGIEGIPTLRAAAKRIHLLIQLRAQIDSGSRVEAVMASAGKSIFWKEKGSVERQLNIWNSASLSTALLRLFDAERALKTSGSLGITAADAALLAISRAAHRRK